MTLPLVSFTVAVSVSPLPATIGFALTLRDVLVATGAGALPLPFSITVCGEPVALSAIDSTAL